MRRNRVLRPLAVLFALGSLGAIVLPVAWADPPLPAPRPAIAPAAEANAPRDRNAVTAPAAWLSAEATPIDLATALRLAGVQNPELNAARQLVLEAVAARQLAAARFLPTLNSGVGYDTHTGNLQQSNGNILSVNRSSVYVGAGSFAVAAGTVVIPGVVLQGNVAEGVYGHLVSRQIVRPLVLIGIMPMLYVTGTSINIQSLLGLIFTVGIKVSATVLMTDVAQELRKIEGLRPSTRFARRAPCGPGRS